MADTEPRKTLCFANLSSSDTVLFGPDQSTVVYSEPTAEGVIRGEQAYETNAVLASELETLYLVEIGSIVRPSLGCGSWLLKADVTFR